MTTIKRSYPGSLHTFDRFLLKEYLQYKILELIYGSKYGDNLYFLGGTALRIVHNNTRFSEDLDFDNFGLEVKDFEELINVIQRGLELEGIKSEFRNVFKGAYRCYLKFPGLLNNLGLSGYEEEKVLIQIDTVVQDYTYKSEKCILNKFDVYTRINVTPADILLSKKICAALERPALKGRDYFDVSYLYSFSSPDFAYLKAKTGIENSQGLREALSEKLVNVDMHELAKDVEPFLFKPEQVNRVLSFKDFISQIK